MKLTETVLDRSSNKETWVLRASLRARIATPLLWCFGGMIALILLLPTIYLLIRSVDAGEEAGQALFHIRTVRVLVRTIWLSFWVTVSCALVAIPLAWLTTRTDLPLRRMWAVLTPLPLVIPSYVGAYLIVTALGPRGILQQLLSPLGVHRLPEIYGFPGALLVLTLLSYPYLLLNIRAVLLRMDPDLEDASRSLGYGPWSTFRRITLPQLRPALAAGGILVALYVLRDFGAVSLMRYSTFTRTIYIQYQSAYNQTVASVLALVLVAITLGILALEIPTRGRTWYYGSTVGAARTASRIVRLGAWRWPALFFCAGVVTVALLLPASVLLYWLLRGLVIGERISSLWLATRNSLLASGLAAVVTLVAAVLVAGLSVRRVGRSGHILERLAYSAFALPGIVVALALVFFGANFIRPFYQTLTLLLVAYLILFLPTAVGPIRSSLLQMEPSLEEAARTLGRRPAQVFRTITLPLVRPGLAAGTGLVFLMTMKELPATLILAPLGFKTLATTVWSSVEDAFFVEAAVPALMIILVSSLPMAWFVLREQSGP